MVRNNIEEKEEKREEDKATADIDQ